MPRPLHPHLSAPPLGYAVVLEGSAVIIDGVKFVLREDRVITTLKGGWPTHGGGDA